MLIRTVKHYRAVAVENLNYPQGCFDCCIGVTGLDEYDQLGVSDRSFRTQSSVIYEPNIEFWKTGTAEITSGEIVYEFMKELFDKSGLDQPPNEVRELCDAN